MKQILPFAALILLIASSACAQKAGLDQIDIPDLEKHMNILAADEMAGRATGEEGLDKAAEYLREQAKAVGLKAIDRDGDYYQNYTLVKKSMDTERSSITIRHEGREPVKISQPFYVFNPDTAHLTLEGEAVFAGYGIYSSMDDYNDFTGVDISGKIVVVMNRGPLDDEGNNLLKGQDWSSSRSFQYKLPGLVMRGAKAIMVVMDPKSGHKSLEDYSPGMARYFNNARYVKEFGQNAGIMPSVATKIIMVHRDVAEEILKPKGKTLAELQEAIDGDLQPRSFDIEGATIEFDAIYRQVEKPVPNVVGIVEGSDPELKNEVIVYTAHFDHLGTDGKGGVYNGADDNASGTVALIELAEAFKSVQDELKRSVLILWVSGEEIGLYGSKYYIENPLLPLEKTVANINLDMIGAVRTKRDTGTIYGEQIGVLDREYVGLIGGHQSSELMQIHFAAMDMLNLKTDTSYNDPDHPYSYYYRSDHINFARHNIPILFYSTGTHVDYHKVSDDLSRIDYDKLKKVNELSFLVGYKLATRPEKIKVDNPFSDWGRMRR